MKPGMKHILLDSSPLGTLSNPAQTPEVIAITAWAANCDEAGHKLYIPEVIDYEIRRELLRAGKWTGIAKLDALKSALNYLPITTDAMLLATDLWAQSRRRGQPTGDPKKLDIDVILAAQMLLLAVPASDLILATANVAHLAQFVPAALWTDIDP
jgi:predicted nucleic acid-binding protein